jgi:hypothetical protein
MACDLKNLATLGLASKYLYQALMQARGAKYKSAEEHLVRTSREDWGADQDKVCLIHGRRREEQHWESQLSENSFPKELKDIWKLL